MQIKDQKIKSYKYFILFGVFKRLLIFYSTVFIIIIIIWQLIGNIYKPVDVPDVKNKNISEAIQKLNNTNLRYEIEKRSSPTVPQNNIILQYPEPGIKVKEGRNITLIVSSGAVTVNIPDLRNLNIFEARRRILSVNEEYSEVGIRIGRIAYVPDNNIPHDNVVSQSPLPNTKVSDNTAISLLMSSGPPRDKIIMLNYVDNNISEVRTIFDDAGINYTVTEAIDKNLEEGTIIRHTPDPFVFIDPTSSVEFVISRQTEESHYNVQRFILIDYLIPDKLISVNLRIVLNDNKGRHEIYNKRTMSGTKVQLSHLVTGNAVMEVYIDGKLEKRERII